MEISREDQRAAMRTTVYDLLVPTWLRWTLGIAFTATFAPAIASLVYRSGRVDRVAWVSLGAFLLACGYVLLRVALVVWQVKRKSDTFAARMAAVALRGRGVRVRVVTMRGGPADGAMVPLRVPEHVPWPESLCQPVAGVSQHYRLDPGLASGRGVTYVYEGECASETDDA